MLAIDTYLPAKMADCGRWVLGTKEGMSTRPSFIAMLFGLTVCAILAITVAMSLPQNEDGTTTRQQIAARTKQQSNAKKAQYQAADMDTYDVVFSPKMIRDQASWVDQNAHMRVKEFAIVNPTPGADLKKTAQACVDAVADNFMVNCYVFANTESYDFKRTKSQYSLVEYCYVVLGRRAGDGQESVGDMREAPQIAEAWGCPGSWMGEGH